MKVGPPYWQLNIFLKVFKNCNPCFNFLGQHFRFMNKKILILNLAYAFGGAEKSIVDVCIFLKKKYDILFFIENKKMQKLLVENEMEFQIINTGQIKQNISLSIIRLFLAFFKILFLIMKVRPDFVFSNSVRSHLIGSLGSCLIRADLIWILRDYQFNRVLYKLFSLSLNG